MEFRALGPVSHHSREGWRAPAGRLQRTLLASLLVRAGDVVPADELIDALWGAEAVEVNTLGRLQVHVHRLRQTLADPSRLAGVRNGYLLHAAPDEVDVLRFEELAAHALHRDTDPQTVVERADAALALWAGQPYEGVATPACESESARLVSRRLTLLEAKYAAHLALGRPLEVLDELERAAAAHPLNEGLQQLLVESLGRLGRRGEALAAFRRARTNLVEELGVEPGARLQRLHEQVLLGEQCGHDEPASFPAPRQLPPAPRLLTGRDEALGRLDEVLGGPGGSIAVLTGTPGVGKTTLALAWAHEHRDRYPDGQLHCDLRGFGSDRPLEPGEVLDSFVRALGASCASLSLEEKSALFRSQVSGRRMLVVLDNAGSEQQVRSLLPATPGCDVLVTSRLSLGGLAVREDAHLMGVAPLNHDVATELLADALGPRLHENPDATRTLLGYCSGLPLALRIVAQQLRSRPSMSVAAFVEEIDEAGTPLDPFDLGETAASVRMVLGWSYDWLGEDARLVLRSLGAFPGPCPDVAAAAAMTGLGHRRAKVAFEVLDRANLVEAVSPSRYRPHDLLRSFAAERLAAEEPAGEPAAMRTRLLRHYVACATTAIKAAGYRDVQGLPRHAEEVTAQAELPRLHSREAARTWFVDHDADLIACAAAHDASDDPSPEGDQLVSDLAQACIGYLLDSGIIATAVPMLHARVRGAHRAGDATEQARALILLGSAKRDAGDTIGAEVDLRAALELALDHGLELVAARGMLNLGVVILSPSRAHEARALYERALEIDERHGEEDHAHLVRQNLVTALIVLGRLDESLELSRRCLALSRAREDAYQTAFSTQLIGEALMRKGALDTALHHARSAQQIATDHGAWAREADIRLLLGQIMMARGDHPAALEEFHAALQNSRAIQSMPIVLDALTGCADALLAMEDDEGYSYLHEARSVAAATGDTELEKQLLARLDRAGLDRISAEQPA